MQELRAALDRLKRALSVQGPLLKRAQRRYKANRRRAYVAHNEQLRAQQSADRLRADGHPRAAARRDREAGRHSHVAYRNHLRAQFWLGRVKVLQQRIHGLKTKAEHFEAEIKKNRAKVSGDGLRVTGGSRRQRLRLAIHTAARNCARGAQNNYYSMSGLARAYAHTLRAYPYGHIWDCSTFGDGTYIVCGLEAPSGPNTLTQGGFTGTQGARGRETPESKAQTGDLVLYGAYPHHHVEVVDDPRAKTTIGHGSAPIDAGVFDLFGDGDYIIRTYL